MKKLDQITINSLKFGIQCNFPTACGEERAKEALDILNELEEFAHIGMAVTKAVEEEYGVIEFVPYAGARTQYSPLKKEELQDIVEWYFQNKK